MSDFLLPDEELRMKQGGITPPAPAPVDTGFLLPGEQTASDQAAITIRRVAGTNPDKAARTKALAILNGLPEPVVERNTEQVEAETKVREMQGLMASSPVLALQMRDPAFAKIAHDDGPSLAGIATTVNPPQKPWLTSNEFSDLVRETRAKNPAVDWETARAMASKQIAGVNNQRQDIGIKSPADTFGNNVEGVIAALPIKAQKVAQGLKAEFADLIGSGEMRYDALKANKQLEIDSALTMPHSKDATTKGLVSGAESLTQQAPFIAASILMANPLPALAGIFLTTQPDAYLKYRARGASGGMAALGATGEAVSEVATEFLPISYAVKKFGKQGFVDFIKGFAGKELAGEELNTIVNDALDTAIANPTKTWGQYLKERPGAAYETLVATLFQSGAMGALNKTATMLAGPRADADQAEKAGAMLYALGEAAKTNKVLARSPADFAAFVDAAAEDGPVQEVHIDARTFMQSAGEALPEILAASPTVAAQLDEAVKNGGDLVIPLGEYTTGIATRDVSAALLPHLRTSADAMSMDDAKTFMQGQVDQFNETIKKELAKHEFDTAFQESRATVEKELFTQLKTAGRFTDDVNQAYATYAARMTAAMAARRGVTPEQQYVDYPLDIVGVVERMAGRQMDQRDPLYVSEVLGEDGPTGQLELQNRRGDKVGEVVINPTQFGDGNAYTIDFLGLSKEHQRAGLGLRAVDAAVDYIREIDPGATHITAEVMSKNIAKLMLHRLGEPEMIADDLRDFTREEALASLPDFTPVEEDGITPRGSRRVFMAWPMPEDQTFNHPAYHGSPHEVDKFSTDFIGTGEGAQAYGWGLYFAENPGVAKGYQEQLSRGADMPPQRFFKGEKLVKGSPEYHAAALVSSNGRTLASVRKEVAGWIKDADTWDARRKDSPSEQSVLAGWKRTLEVLNEAASKKDFTEKPHDGHFYTVDIPDEVVARMLLWDKPLSEQPENVRKVLEGMPWLREMAAQNAVEDDALLAALDQSTGEGVVPSLPNITGQQVYEGLARQMQKPEPAPGWTSASVDSDGRAWSGQEAASKYLDSLGIPGVKYLDQGSRPTRRAVSITQSPSGRWAVADQMGGKHYFDTEAAARAAAKEEEGGTHNLVVFNDENVKLTHKDGKAVTAAERAEYFQDMTQQRDANFAAWSEGAPLISADDTYEYQGGPAVFEAFHGTTHDDIVKVNPKPGKGSAEGHLGKGFYVTTSREDASENYAGEGPDLTGRIEREKEQMADSWYGDVYVRDEMLRDYLAANPEALAQAADEVGTTVENFDLDELNEGERDSLADTFADAAMTYAARETVAGKTAGLVMPVFVKFTNPFDIRPNGLDLTYEVEYTEDGDIVEDSEKGTALDFLQALRTVADQWNADVSDIESYIFESMIVGTVSAYDIWQKAQSLDGLLDDGSGEPVSAGEFMQAVAREAGYDGFVMDADMAFGAGRRGFGGIHVPSMAGVQPGTLHLMPFTATQVKSATGNNGTFDPTNPNILEQNQQAGARGNITFGNDITQTPSVIGLLNGADLSTFHHELGHFYLEVMTHVASQPGAPAEIVDDVNKVLKWFGVSDTATWNAMSLEEKRPYHEQFARGHEAYLFEGKSPSLEMQGIFQRFRSWMISVYRDLKALKVELTDEVRGVYDRLVATNEEIIAAEEARGFNPLFAEKPADATEADWKAYQDADKEATQAAVDELQTRSLRDMKWLGNAKSRMMRALQRDAKEKRKAVEAEVTAEVQAQPIYAAMRFLKYGKLPEADRTNAENKLLDSMAGANVKLSLADLKEMYGEGPAAPWRYLPVGKTGLAAVDGVSPDIIAELFGFTSGDHLVRTILEAQPESTVIEGMTDQRMLERYGDLTSPDVIERAADQAIHNDARARFAATEYKFAARLMTPVRVLMAAAKDAATRSIAQKKIRDVKPAQYSAAEARAIKTAQKARGKDDQAMITATRDKLLNNALAREAHNVVSEVEKAVKYLKRIGDSKTIDPDYREQIVALLDRFDLRQISNKEADRRKTLLEWIDDQKAKGYEPVIDDALINEALRKPYRDMTVEGFRGLVDSIKNIEHLGRLKHKLLTAKDAREFAERVAEAEASIVENAKRSIPEEIERNSWTSRMKKGVTEFFVMHRKLAAMLREMDGYKDGGVLWELITRPMNEAGDHEAVLREQATMKLHDLFAPIIKAGKLKEKTFIPEINNSLSREGRIMVALNTGNEGNLQRLMDGDRWSASQVRAILATLTREELDFVQSVWDMIDSYRPQIAEQQRRITGVLPEWIEATPLAIEIKVPEQIVNGEIVAEHTEIVDLRGGYFPAKYDTDRSTRSLSDEASANIMDQWRGAKGAAKARDSFTKARAEAVVNRPLRKDFGVITQHLSEVTHRLAWQDFIIDANRLVRAAPIDSAIREHYGPEVLKSLRDAIADIAIGEIGAQNAFEAAINYVRMGATIAGLGWRVTTSLLQPLGLTQSMVRIGPKWVARGLVDWIGDAAKMENTAAKIYEKSDFMRLRGKTMQREISEIRNTVDGKGGAIEASYFYLIQKMQIVADIPTWLGQYHKAVEGGKDEATAVALADQAVLDAQGGGQVKDLAAIQRGGPMLKLFTNFYSFFNTTYQLTSESVGRTKFTDPISVGRLAVDMLLLYSVPAALGTILKAVLKGDDDEDKFVKQLIADQLTYLFGTVVGLREAAGGLQTALGLPGDYSGPASVRLFAEIAKLGKQASQGEIDEALLKAANSVGGILFHYPAGQVNATASGIAAMADGKTQNPGALLVGGPRQ